MLKSCLLTEELTLKMQYSINAHVLTKHDDLTSEDDLCLRVAATIVTCRTPTRSDRVSCHNRGECFIDDER